MSFRLLEMDDNQGVQCGRSENTRRRSFEMCELADAQERIAFRFIRV